MLGDRVGLGGPNGGQETTWLAYALVNDESTPLASEPMLFPRIT